MHASEWVSLAAPAVILLLAILGGFRLFGRLEQKLDHLHERIDGVEKQFKPNGGSSLKDDMNVLKGDVRDLGTKLGGHIDQHNGRW